ncbi:MAG: hypothetical protein ACXABY_10020 [Candidatus Thorarchaeota archaeon]|jgi:hypothetical protein
MAIPRALVVDSNAGGAGAGAFVYYMTNSIELNLLGSPLLGEQVTSVTTEERNYSSNCVVMIGSKVYTWIGGRIYRMDISSPTGDWVLIHTLPAAAAAVDHIKTGFFNAMIDGDSYLIGVYPGASLSTAVGFRINLQTEVVEETSVTDVGNSITRIGFRSPVQFREKLFFISGAESTGSPTVIIYNPQTNELSTAPIGGPGLETGDAQHSLVVFDGVLYLFGKLEVSIGIGAFFQWEYESGSNTFVSLGNIDDFVGDITNYPAAYSAAWVTRSSEFVENRTGATQSIYLLLLGRAHTIWNAFRGWNLIEIYEVGDSNPTIPTSTKFSSKNWSQFALPANIAGEGIDQEITEGLTPFSNMQDMVTEDPRVWFYYTKSKEGPGGSVSLYEFLPRVPAILTPHPQLQLINTSGPGGGSVIDGEAESHFNMPATTDGGSDKLFTLIDDDEVNMRIEGHQKILGGQRIFFTLWGPSVTGATVVQFLFSTDQEVPKDICSLSNPSHGVLDVGTFGSTISELSADNGVTKYSVDWLSGADGVSELNVSRLVGRVIQ